MILPQNTQRSSLYPPLHCRRPCGRLSAGPWLPLAAAALGLIGPLQASAAARAPAATEQRLGPIRFSTTGGQIQIGMSPAGQFNVSLTGRSTISLLPPGPGGRRTQVTVQADRIQFTVTADMKSVQGTADGHVSMKQIQDVPASGGFAAGQSALIVSGGHASYAYESAPAAGHSQADQTVEITINPVVELSHPRLDHPSSLVGASTIRVDLATSAFTASAPNGQSLDLTIDPAAPARTDAPTSAPITLRPILYDSQLPCFSWPGGQRL